MSLISTFECIRVILLLFFSPPLSCHKSKKKKNPRSLRLKKKIEMKTMAMIWNRPPLNSVSEAVGFLHIFCLSTLLWISFFFQVLADCSQFFVYLFCIWSSCYLMFFSWIAWFPLWIVISSKSDTFWIFKYFPVPILHTFVPYHSGYNLYSSARSLVFMW